MYILKNGYIILNNELIKKDIYIKDNKIVEHLDDGIVIDCTDLLITPGICDIHVHLREPGFVNKETIKSGTMSAAKGGVTSLFAMPNLKPCPDSLTNLAIEEEIIKKDAVVKVYPFASLTKNEQSKELSDIKELSTHVLAFSDDGVGFRNLDLLKEGMNEVKKYNRIICSHAEDYNYLPTDNNSEAEAVRKELELVSKLNCKYHFCHISCKESFKLIKEAQDKGLNVTCEVTPHHLFLNKDMIKGDPNFKMNPPLRSKEDQIATIKALLSGVANVVATDHAPHTKTEKSLPYEKALNGIIGLETLVPLIYTNLIRTNLASLDDFINWLINNPRKIMGLNEVKLESGYPADIACFDIFNKHKYNEEEIKSKAVNSPFIGYELYGFCKYCFVDGKLVYGGE